MMVVRILPMAYCMGDQIRPCMDLRPGSSMASACHSKASTRKMARWRRNMRKILGQSLPAEQGVKPSSTQKNPLWHY
jgi:hypothetical protein